MNGLPLPYGALDSESHVADFAFIWFPVYVGIKDCYARWEGATLGVTLKSPRWHLEASDLPNHWYPGAG